MQRGLVANPRSQEFTAGRMEPVASEQDQPAFLSRLTPQTSSRSRIGRSRYEFSNHMEIERGLQNIISFTTIQALYLT